MCYKLSQEEIKMVLEIINTIAIIAASGVAIYGINAWRKEFQGKRKIELAEEVLVLFYEAKDAVRAIRNPVGYSGEVSTRNHLNEPLVVRAFYERYEKRQEVFNKLYSKRYQFMARFGSDKTKPFKDLKEIMDDMYIAARTLVRISEYHGNDRDKNVKDEIRKNELCILSSDADDPIATRMDKVISDIEAICKPIILGKSN